MKNIIFPPSLIQHDRIVVIAPATKVKAEYVEGLCEALRVEGFDACPSPHALSSDSGSFAASLPQRLADLTQALEDDTVKCIFCARGGYGCQQLLPFLNKETVRNNPKWIVGFSDISALHALWLSAGVASIHGPMGKHFSLTPDHNSAALVNILKGRWQTEISIPSHPLNIPGHGKGRLIGGNLAVLNGLAATPYDILSPESAHDAVLFIEDVGENIYEIDRILTRLAMAGTLNVISALIVGHFTEYGVDLNYRNMEEMIASRLQILKEIYKFDFPVLFDSPVGHVQENHPFVEGAEAEVISSDRAKSSIIIK
ncbi:MAG: LD-carboxypeptidase [Muribaculaceae bacterium]|nr:LD-carboxypeptidase [Muribaculaceae bacterium]